MYTKTNAEIEMKKINREEFWEQAKVGMNMIPASVRREEKRDGRRRGLTGRRTLETRRAALLFVPLSFFSTFSSD